ncbi:MAG TPA: lysylphosphatidylglycerol synthase transmembrane domain-containing protein [Vicinamibacterales bacterium]|nr:lysylphosphatidylglycerol synthase transmembrane domain-containing protein [Vicinamibacterales bacterium]
MHAIWLTVANSVARLSTANPGYAAAAFLLYVVSLVIAGARWRGFLRALGGEVSVMRATLATMGGIAAGNLTPSPGGEACRIGLVRLGGRATWREATIAAVWDRLSELPPILVLAAMSLVAVRHLALAGRTSAVVAGISLALVIVGLALWRLVPKAKSRGRRGWRRSGFALAGWRERLAVDRVRPSLFAAGVGYSSLLWLQDVLRLGCATLAFGVVLSPTKIATLSILAMLGGIVPAIAGLGPVEGGLLAGLMAFGVDLPTAAAVTALERAISYGFSTSAGAMVIALMGGRSVWSAVRER